MAPSDDPRDIAAAWQPQRPGRRSARDIPDAIVEPDWGGLRVAAAMSADRASLYRDGAEVRVPEDLLRALTDGFGAMAAVIEGHLTTAALRSGEGAFPPTPKVERPPLLVPRALRKNVRDDPYVHARDHEVKSAGAAAGTLAALERGERHAFVATDLLWLDGEPLEEVPLLERKRLLEGVIDVSYLVRVSVYVRPSAAMTLVSWGSLGFSELSYRGTNSRYLPGQENPDWVVARAPHLPSGPSAAPAPPR